MPRVRTSGTISPLHHVHSWRVAFLSPSLSLSVQEGKDGSASAPFYYITHRLPGRLWMARKLLFVLFVKCVFSTIKWRRMKWGCVCAAYGKASNGDQISVRKLERKRECVGRRRLWEESFKTDPELCVGVRSVLMWYRTGCSSRSSVQGKSSIRRWTILNGWATVSFCNSTLLLTRSFYLSLSCHLLVGYLFVTFSSITFYTLYTFILTLFMYAHIYIIEQLLYSPEGSKMFCLQDFKTVAT